MEEWDAKTEIWNKFKQNTSILLFFYYLCSSIIINNYTFRGNIQNSKYHTLKFSAEDTRFIIQIKNDHFRGIASQKRVSKTIK